MFAADTLSRAVDKHENLISEKGADIQAYVDMIVTPLPVSPEKTEQIRNATDADLTMAQLKRDHTERLARKGTVQSKFKTTGHAELNFQQ